jgi:membrane-bound lytic murein transglycosylase B
MVSIVRASRGCSSKRHYQPAIVAAMDRPLLEPPSGTPIRGRFVAGGAGGGRVAYWNANAAALAAAEERYARPREIVVGIIGVETFYGRSPATIACSIRSRRSRSTIRGALRSFAAS